MENGFFVCILNDILDHFLLTFHICLYLEFLTLFLKKFLHFSL